MHNCGMAVQGGRSSSPPAADPLSPSLPTADLQAAWTAGSAMVTAEAWSASPVLRTYRKSKGHIYIEGHSITGTLSGRSTEGKGRAGKEGAGVGGSARGVAAAARQQQLL